MDAAEFALKAFDRQFGSTCLAEFVPMLDYPVDFRTVICTVNAIESIEPRPFT